MDVWVVSYSDYDTHWIEEVFSTEEKADEYIKKREPNPRNRWVYDKDHLTVM